MRFKRNRAPASVWRNPVHFLAFGLGTGASPYAPGTVGTLLGIPLVHMLAGSPLWLYLLVTVVLVVAGIWISDKTSKDIGVHDHSGIVIDEVAGYLVTMIAIPVNPWTLVSGFLVFRVFDIVKPWPIGTVDRRLKGGPGIMVDDLLAGFYSWILMVAGIWFYT
jgi:phosphatidylglycerophosphatase A